VAAHRPARRPTSTSGRRASIARRRRRPTPNAAANSVAEGAAVNTLVGITANSTDAEQAVTYSLASDSSGGGFKIDATTGVVTVADPSKINFETAAGHAYTITVNSNDGYTTSSQSFTINVTDIAPSTAGRRQRRRQYGGGRSRRNRWSASPRPPPTSMVPASPGA
jgi:hypothetical protein